MNGNTTAVLVWAVNLLLGLVLGMVGIILRLHQKSDHEHRTRAEKEIDLLRFKMHDVQSKVAGIEMLLVKERK